jgi:hypothetical protein
MRLALEAAAWLEILSDGDTLLGIIARVAFVVCAVLAVAKLMEQILSTPTHEEKHFWHRKK